ncbi:hypothetical protein CTA1_1148 [Colletotrichum tanaceti]|uniref:Uncharacterized protein n=1 Tax=Colletotrichum tanaceti TaxID=1306861 RepID=A0A4U6XID7_9PEZI|nr:hypothetical protein CTA1_1148 [Colletotrichum tanaceti]
MIQSVMRLNIIHQVSLIVKYNNVAQAARNDLCRAPEILEPEPLIGPLGVGLQNRPRAGAVDDTGDARLGVQPHVGVERRAHGRDRPAKDLFAVRLDRLHQRLVAGKRAHRVREQQTADVHRDAGHRGSGGGGGGVGDGPADLGFDLGRVLLGDHAAVELEGHLAGHDVGVGAALDAADVEVGVGDALHPRAHPAVARVEGVQRVEDSDGALQRVDPGVRDGGVGLAPAHRDLHLQAPVVGRDDLVREARGDEQVGLRETLAQQPAGAELAPELLVVGEVKLDRAAQRGGGAEGLQRTHRECKGREVALADGGGPAVEDAVLDLGGVRVARPALARRHHVAVGVKRHGAAGAGVSTGVSAKATADDEVRDGLHAVGADLGGGHRVALGFEAEFPQQLGGALRVRRVVAGRRVGGHAHQGLEEAHLLVEVSVDPSVEALVTVAHFGLPDACRLQRRIGRCGGKEAEDINNSL